MSELKDQERTAIEAVAKRFSATWEKRNEQGGAFIMLAGKRVAVEVATLRRRGTGEGDAAGPRLRFDKVATRLMERLQATLGKAVPDGMTVSLTITAPIRLPSRTTAALEDKVKILLGRRSPGRDEEATFNGNCVRIRLLKVESGHAPKMIGFVHNSDSNPLLLLDMTSEWLKLIEAGRRAAKWAGDRWLVVTTAGGMGCLAAHRCISSQLRSAGGFKKIVGGFGDGRVEVLAG